MDVHNTNIANFLRFLGYWDEFGYEKNTSFSSSIRLELVVKKEQDQSEKLYIQFIYDDLRIKFPWCNDSQGYFCAFDEFIEYAI